MQDSEFAFHKTEFQGVYEIRPFCRKDNRGFLEKGYSHDMFSENGIDFRPVETLLMESERNVLRGLHFQREKPVKKFLTCIYGELFAVVADITKGSKNFGRHLSFTLKEGEQLYVGAGYALGTYAVEKSLFLCENGERLYPEYDAGIKWDDPSLGICWPCYAMSEEPVLSPKDKKLSGFREYAAGEADIKRG